MTTAHTLYAMTATRSERIIQRAALVVIALGLVLGVCAWLTANGNLPAAPWSPIGKQQQIDRRWDKDRQTELEQLRDEQRERLYGSTPGESA